jgi:TolB-like protein/Tfp pilus assembly protein PilF
MIVVFPFENMGSADDQYFAAGISEEITSRLSALSGLGVVSRTSAVQYDRTGKTMQRIADDLGVDYVLDGTVRWARASGGGSQVRITPQLIRAREDRQVWSASYDRSIDEIFRIQSEIATEVVDKLGTTLAPQEREALATAPTNNVEAYQAFLRAAKLIDLITFEREDFDKGVAYLEDACAKDPEFLRAFSDLGKAHAGYLHFAWDASPERLARSKAAIDRALAIDPDSPWAQFGLGYYHYWGRKDYESAYAAFTKAQAGLPSSADVVQALALVRRRQAKFEEAAELMRKASVLDPRNALVFFTRAETLAVLRRYDEARESAAHAVSLSPDSGSGSMLEARIAVLAGDVEGARAAFARSMERASRSSELRSVGFWTAISIRDYDAALGVTEHLPEAANTQFAFECRSAARGWALKLRGDGRAARAEFERALPILEAYAREHPGEANVRSMLGKVLANRDRPDDALREANAALTLPPATTDAWLRHYRLFDRAVVEIVAGKHDAAVEHLGELLSQPCDQVSVDLLRLSPLFDPLRDHPGFQRLIAR